MEARAPYNATVRTHMQLNTTLHQSPWHSPVPYLFGGLAAMLGLIAFALLILACSYWKLSGQFENEGEGSSGQSEGDLEAGEGKGDDTRLRPVMEPKVLVIMAGEVKPTFLATPIGSSFSFGHNGERICCCNDDKGVEHGGAKVVGDGGDGRERTETRRSSAGDGGN
ncbi:Protein GLUTAMINE DUMPER 1 [Hibiscus syriacus]|uniref:Protein GLUTAMINE DUMPER 1 n=1 Tax=Hibiscus syriacus TaxID=106335 RepID=A0A6A2Y4D2_HIBSY|nr:protein GLUTAMINE DUMPER 3-like [Hibiscus syriacus]KAE8678820.1 Protein GLUTAMINE DUMPER 1 [Hibiscus syriacus]